MKGVEKYWYQIETVKKVLKNFHGRVLLSDEVGLGKTIEAGMILKEYLLRGMVKNILILTPAPLVSQWKEEMLEKFDINFVTTDDALFHDNHFLFWKNKFIIASIHTAKSAKNSANVINEFFDLVVVDEAHHLKNQNTLAWKLVNEIKKRFIFLLTATPVQNNLIELFNLITLLKPGQFKTKKSFKAEYVQKGDESKPIHKDALRELLKDVMIRNTRSAIDVKLPKRFATTLKLDPTEIEREIYMNISEFIKETGENIPSRTVQLLMQEAGSSPFALKKTLINSQFAHLSGGVGAIIKKIDKIDVICKEKALLELILKNPDEKKVIFTQYLKSMDYIMHILNKNNLKFVTFRGDMTTHEKDQSINSFKENVPILLSSESGGEGRNLQFCNTIINFDLPWNPMKIEQRIGRLHRIGQTRDVFIFNLSIKNTIEDYIINILDNKINMFEMVIGEIEPILGYLGEDKEFENIIFEIWLRNSTQDKIEKGFNEFGENMIKAKTEYLNSKEIDKEIFGEDYEV
ncbi:DEAD/DEAH box helicase family protein [Candidatus Desantisbacteria bacterium]|nr:DEAD/DEAH box helicase family protein [Candidatus Desantisbacteria bacterium]